MSVEVKIEGLEELIKTIKQLKKIPQRSVTKAAKSGSNLILKEVRNLAPVRTGALKKGIILIGEKFRKKAKKVYQVVMDANMNDTFVKISKEGKRYYYPASMEYGFITKGGSKTTGKRFLRNGADAANNVATTKMVQVLTKEIDKLR